MKLKVALLVAIMVLLSFVSTFAQSINIVSNPGFEEGEGGDAYFWTKNSWEDKGEFKWDETQNHSGKKSACIINNQPSDSRFKQQVKVKPGTYYKLSCWIKTENVGMDTKGANMSIDGLIDTSKDIKGTNKDWEYVELFGLSGQNQQNFTLTLGLGGYSSLNTGKAWFDDVSVEELKSAPEQGNAIKLYNDTQGATSKGSSGGGNSWIVLIAVSVLFVAAVGFIILRRRNRAPEEKGAGTHSKTTAVTEVIETRLKLDKNDFIIMAAMTLVYLVIALFNLGSMNVPKTSWTPSKSGENVILDLGKEVNLSKIYYYCGLGNSRPNEGVYRVQYEDETQKFVPLATIDKKDIFIWKTVNTPNVKARRLKILVDAPSGTLNEIGFFEQGSNTPLTGIKIVDKTVDENDEGKVENLFDEQSTIDLKHSFMTGMIFDEIYHARTAYEYLHHMEPFEWTHPPLGKIIISIGIIIFGMDPFGWRIMGTLFGAAMIPVMYLFGRKLFSKKFYAFCAAFLMMFDFMHFGLTRISTIDVYGTFFVILMYYFMYDYFNNKSYTLGLNQSLKPLFFCGLVFGMGAASKWIGVYAGGGLALLFFLAKYYEYKDYIKESGRRKSQRPSWTKAFIPLYINRTVLYCVLFFIIIPGIIYMLSYIPYMMVPGPGHGFDLIFRNQAAMYKYHSHDVLGATHPFSSYWWEWPLMRRPLETYIASDLPAGMSSSMTLIGNPAIWWVGIVAVIAAVIIAFRKRDKKMAVVFIAMAFQYLTWVGVTRIVFIYHFFSSIPFVILSIVYVIKSLLDKYPEAKYIVYVYLAVVLLLFVMFYPVLSGMEVSRSYVENYLLWFKGKWVF